MSYLKALTKDSIGDRKFKLQTDLDDVKFDEDMKIKKQKKVESEQLGIANAVTASKEVRRRAIDKKNGVEQKDDDDIVEVRKEIDNAIFAVQISHIPVSKSTKSWKTRPLHWHQIVKCMTDSS